MNDAVPLRIGLKYCGGCKPGYDRVALVEEIRARIAPGAELVPPESGGIDLVLAVQGCPTACADLTGLGGRRTWLVTSPRDAEGFILYVETRLRKEYGMRLSREEIRNAIAEWNRAWERYDLEGVLALMHEDVVFENWTGGRAVGKEALRKAWQPWFAAGGFRFIEEDLFIDEARQKVLFRWILRWPSPEKGFEGQPEERRGVDVMHFKAGRIIDKLTYSKTTVEIDGQRLALHL